MVPRRCGPRVDAGPAGAPPRTGSGRSRAGRAGTPNASPWSGPPPPPVDHHLVGVLARFLARTLQERALALGMQPHQRPAADCSLVTAGKAAMGADRIALREEVIGHVG